MINKGGTFRSGRRVPGAGTSPNWSCKADLDRGSRARTTVSNGLGQRDTWAEVICNYRPADDDLMGSAAVLGLEWSVLP